MAAKPAICVPSAPLSVGIATRVQWPAARVRPWAEIACAQMSLAERATAVQGPKAGPGEGAGDHDLPVKRTTYGVSPNSALDPKAQRVAAVAARFWKFVPRGNTV